MTDAIVTANKLKLFWNKADTTVKWKLQVYDAIIRSKLLYGLECIQLANVEQDKLNAFQMKGIRRILKIPPTEIDRQWTNKKVWDKATEESGKYILKFTEMWYRQKYKRLGHLLRSEPDNPLHRVVFRTPDKHPRITGIRGVGRPREDWLYETMKDAFNIVTVFAEDRHFNPENQQDINTLIQAAKARTDIFETNNKPKARDSFANKNMILSTP